MMKRAMSWREVDCFGTYFGVKRCFEHVSKERNHVCLLGFWPEQKRWKEVREEAGFT